MQLLTLGQAQYMTIRLVDDTDYVTPETGVSGGSITWSVSKNGGSFVTITPSAVSEIGNGEYRLLVAAGDIDTAGRFLLVATGSGFFGREEAQVGALDAVTDAITQLESTMTARFDSVDDDLASVAAIQGRINRPVPPAFTMVLGRRNNGDIAAENKLTVGVDDKPKIAFDVSKIYGPADFVATVGTPTITPSAELTLSVDGPRDSLAVFTVEGSQHAGQEYKVESLLTLESGAIVKAIGFVDCVADPTA